MNDKTQIDSTSAKSRAQYAGLALRSIAMVVDLSIVLGIVSMAELIIQRSGLMVPTATHLTVLAAFSAVIAVGYFTIFESSAWRSTPGKRWMGLRVTDLSGKRISKPKALARAVLNVIGLATLGVHSLTAIKHKKVQTQPDKWTGVVVLQKPPQPTAAKPSPTERLIPVAACIGMAALLGVGYQTKEVQTAVPALYEPPIARMSVDLMERSTPLREFVLSELIANGRVPAEIPDHLAKGLPRGKLGSVSYDRRSGNIIISMRTSDRKATIALTPVARGQGQWRWACGLVGIQPSEVPASCRRD